MKQSAILDPTEIQSQSKMPKLLQWSYFVGSKPFLAHETHLNFVNPDPKTMGLFLYVQSSFGSVLIFAVAFMYSLVRSFKILWDNDTGEMSIYFGIVIAKNQLRVNYSSTNCIASFYFKLRIWDNKT